MSVSIAPGSTTPEVAEFDATLQILLENAVGAVSDVRSTIALADHDLLGAQRKVALVRQSIDAVAAIIAGEVRHRSRRELGYNGLAQRAGFRTAELLVQHETGSTSLAAATLVAVGTLALHALDPTFLTPEHLSDPTPTEPWLSEVAVAVSKGEVAVDVADAIRRGLGRPSLPGAAIEVSKASLATAAGQLLAEAAHIHADRVLQRARELRDELDEAGIIDRERAIHESRSIRRVRPRNGSTRYIVDTDLESAALWDSLYDTLTSPRRGGPRFVAETEKEWATIVSTDKRTLDQYAHDAITQILRIGIDTEGSSSSKLLGARQPAVRVLVSGDALRGRSHYGRIEGTSTPISIATVERLACDSGTVPLAFDDNGQALNLGRETRFHTPHQRILIAARDGGCLFEGCDRPPSWCEVHHVRHWQRDRGETSIENGILLCRHHHLLAHNNGWEFTHDDAGYWIIPPSNIDALQTPRLLPSKSAALRDLKRLKGSIVA
jgi:hypothetical protein